MSDITEIQDEQSVDYDLPPELNNVIGIRYVWIHRLMFHYFHDNAWRCNEILTRGKDPYGYAGTVGSIVEHVAREVNNLPPQTREAILAMRTGNTMYNEFVEMLCDYIENDALSGEG